MSEIVALVENGQINYYDTDGNRIEPKKTGKSTLYLILPDEFFFFFQTDIEAKRGAISAVEAYAKSTFPLEIGSVGYIRETKPLIGYLYLKDKETPEIAELIKTASLVTTPFLVYFNAFRKEPFIYRSERICAACRDGALLFYKPGECPEDKSYDTEGFKRLQPNREELFRLLKRIIHSKEKAKIAITTGRRINISEWKLHRFALIALALILLLGGEVLRYVSYNRELNYQQEKLKELYKKALGNKHYTDPYGVLLYMAKGTGYSRSITPTRLLYYLSKAKNGYDIVIDKLTYANGNIHIEGSSKSYAAVAGYVEALRKIMNRQVNIQNTESSNGKLRFTLYIGGG